MAGKAHDVGAEGGLIDGDGARALRDIQDEDRASVMGRTSHRSYVVNIARHVRHVGHDDDVGLQGEQTLVFVEAKRTVGVDRRHIDGASALVARPEQGAQHRIVRCGGSERTAFVRKRSRDGRIERGRSVRGESDARSIRRAKELRRTDAGIVERLARGEGSFMDAATRTTPNEHKARATASTTSSGFFIVVAALSR